MKQTKKKNLFTVRELCVNVIAGAMAQFQLLLYGKQIQNAIAEKKIYIYWGTLSLSNGCKTHSSSR